MSQTFMVMTENMDLPVTGGDSMILVPPDGVFVDGPDGRRAMVMSKVIAGLRVLSFDAAARLGEKLHHAEWKITTDPDEVRKANIHDCPSCREGTLQALARLAEFPHQELFVGVCFWAGPVND